MARQAREKSKTGMYNIILKGKEDIFREDEDYNEFIARAENSSADILGFGLISRYAFMCIKESENGIAADMRTIIIGYARYYNKKYNISGRLFDGRFKSEPVNSNAELKNSISIVQSVTEITGEEAYVTENTMNSSYEMLPFYAAAMGKKAISRSGGDKNKHKNEHKNEHKNVKNAEKSENKKVLPSWLL